MLINRIKARNFKTYLNLDLDISTEPDRPIILIGGKNGGGKTTLFEAIYGALYGLHLKSAAHFRELLNAGALGKEDEKILLELIFTGKVLNEDQKYVLTRTYILNPAGLPVENVRLNMNGAIFSYGTATPAAQRALQEAEVNKIIKANLPQELSHYFLFDAMEAGKLLKEDQLNKVIKENIENVMGFNKFMQLASASENLFQQYTAQRIQVEKEKEEYLQLLSEKKQLDAQLLQLEQQLQDAFQYSVANQELYDNLKSGMSQETTIKNKIEQTKTQIAATYEKESLFRAEAENLVKNLELDICIPKLVEAIKSEVNLILKARKELEQKQNIQILPEQIEAISYTVLEYLRQRKIPVNDITTSELVDYVMSVAMSSAENNTWDFLDHSEVRALEDLLNAKSNNPFPTLNQQRIEMNLSIGQIATLKIQMEQMKSQITGRDYSLLKAFEENENNIKTLQQQITELKTAIGKIEKRLQQFDIQTNQEPDPKYDTLAKLKGFFEDTVDLLLRTKKQQIELNMKNDLNMNMEAYRDVVGRVELSEQLSRLTFKIFHKAGNEIYLNQLNTASKQIVVQVLLKSLHEFGDYDPPVMIDTVMGVLDETSRSTLLENYFPELSHQSILFSSDSEIRPGTDFQKLEPFVSKSYTLVRDVELQHTNIAEGYFGKTLND